MVDPRSHEVRPEDAPFHQGERAVQTRAHVRERLARIPPRGFRAALTEQHRTFYGQLPWLLVASVDNQLQPWASALVGAPGFVTAPDPQRLQVRARPLAGDPLQQNLQVGAALGMLGIQLQTRRRNRVNGVVESLDEQGFVLQVGQSFGNCNQYIQAREPTLVEPSQPSGPVQTLGAELPERALQMITQADTFFIASATRSAVGAGAAIHGADISHRGGNPGFVQVTEGNLLTVPDYPGNNFFNTFGNLELWPHAGLLFPDFDRGDLLSLTGRTDIVWEGDELEATPGAERLLRVQITGGVLMERALPLRWTAPELSEEMLALRAAR
ncbi:MAG: pyridoxamine 5'-phosphate oxidase family protein [Polyangiales bacterium]